MGFQDLAQVHAATSQALQPATQQQLGKLADIAIDSIAAIVGPKTSPAGKLLGPPNQNKNQQAHHQLESKMFELGLRAAVAHTKEHFSDERVEERDKKAEQKKAEEQLAKTKAAKEEEARQRAEADRKKFVHGDAKVVNSQQHLSDFIDNNVADTFARKAGGASATQAPESGSNFNKIKGMATTELGVNNAWSRQEIHAKRAGGVLDPLDAQAVATLEEKERQEAQKEQSDHRTAGRKARSLLS